MHVLYILDIFFHIPYLYFPYIPCEKKTIYVHGTCLQHMSYSGAESFLFEVATTHKSACLFWGKNPLHDLIRSLRRTKTNTDQLNQLPVNVSASAGFGTTDQKSGEDIRGINELANAKLQLLSKRTYEGRCMPTSQKMTLE